MEDWELVQPMELGTWIRRRLRWSGLTGIVLVASAFLPVGITHAQSDLCDASLPSPKEDPLGYRLRGDRCEGRYIKEVGSTTLTIGSIVESWESIDRTSSKPLNVIWPVPHDATDVRLRAQGLKRRLYYRMDTRRPAAVGSYIWPSNLLAAMGPGSGDIGILASTRLRVGGIEREVYLPVRVGYAQSLPRKVRYEFVVIPGIQLSELFITLSELESDGRVRRVIRKNEPLQYGYYPAERGIVISIPTAELGTGGLYQVELVARLEPGGVATEELWFYHRASHE